MTTQQIRNRTKTVTRRIGWATLKPGTLLQPVVKSQGLKRGEKVEKIGGPIRVLKVTRDRLDEMTFAEVTLEGFPGWSVHEFFFMFCQHNRCEKSTVITRIEFEYVD
jgi:hypothetical protein